MDTAFLLNDQGRSDFLQFAMRSFGCTYICLWSYIPLPSNCLLFKDGIYNEEHDNNRLPSSSTFVPSVSRRLFDEYRNSVFTVESDVPGFAFINNIPYFQLKDSELIKFASIQLQTQFYQEARIKTAIFMGCKSGEIEIGFSNVQIHLKMEMEIRNWFQQNFLQNEFLPQTTTDQSRVVSSSSSSLRSMESPEYSPLMFNMPTPSPHTSHLDHFKETTLLLDQASRPTTTLPTSLRDPHDQLQAAIQPFTQPQTNLFPSLGNDIDAAMTRAMFAVISSTSSSSSHQSRLNLPLSLNINQESSAFKRYSDSGLSPLKSIVKSSNFRRQNMFKRVVTYLRSLSLRRINERTMQANPPTSTQLHHMISERKRREKLNDSFHALRSLIPPGSKKDKASVLANTREYLTTLKAQVSDLTRKNELLEAQLLSRNRENDDDDDDNGNEKEDGGASLSGGIRVRIIPASESSSTERMVNLRATRVGDGCRNMEMVIRLLEFLKNVENVSVVSMEAQTRVVGLSNSMELVVLRLKIKGNEWDKSAFQEAIERVLADLAQ